MLGQTISMVLPKVVGYKLIGSIGKWTTSTDVVLTITKVDVCVFVCVLVIIGASPSEPQHVIWRLEMVPWSMRETDAIRNKDDCRTCCPL